MYKLKTKDIKGYRYQLNQDFYIQTNIATGYDILIDYYVSLSSTGYLCIQKGYAWNGANFPSVNIKANKTASLVHDALYQLINADLLCKKYKKSADILYREICIEEGMWLWYAWASYYAIRAFQNAKEALYPVIY